MSVIKLSFNLSSPAINAVTDKLLSELQAWHERELERVYPVTIHFAERLDDHIDL